MIGYDQNFNCLIPKSKVDVKTIGQLKNNKPRSSETIITNNPCFVAFDIMYLNGRSLSKEKLSERHRILLQTVTPNEGRLHISEKHLVKDNFTA